MGTTTIGDQDTRRRAPRGREGRSGTARDRGPDGPDRRRNARSEAFLVAFTRALRDPATYSVRTNAGLWLGFVLALPIPGLILLTSPPAWILVASLAAPFGWAIVVGASRRVGILGEEMIGRMATAAATEETRRDAERVDLTSAVELERGERERLDRLRRAAEAELALGQSIQRSLVPPDLEEDGVSVAVRLIPCAHVGGDYVQASMPRPGLLYLCVGDVSGHGVAAALVVSRLHSLVQTLVIRESPPGPFLEALNREALRVFADTSIYMTLAVLRVDLRARRIEYATAGHPAQYLLRRRGGIEALSTPNRPLGMETFVLDATRPVGSIPYEDGDTVLLFTDGLFEVFGAQGGEMWGEERLRAACERPSFATPGELLTTLLDAAGAWRGAAPVTDDVALVAARLGTNRPAATRAPASPRP